MRGRVWGDNKCIGIWQYRARGEIPSAFKQIDPVINSAEKGLRGRNRMEKDQHRQGKKASEGPEETCHPRPAICSCAHIPAEKSAREEGRCLR